MAYNKTTTKQKTFYLSREAHAKLLERILKQYGPGDHMSQYIRDLITADMQNNGHPNFDPGITNGGNRHVKGTKSGSQ